MLFIETQAEAKKTTAPDYTEKIYQWNVTEKFDKQRIFIFVFFTGLFCKKYGKV